MNASRIARIIVVAALVAGIIVPGLAGQRRHRLRSIKADVTEKKITRKAIPEEVLQAFEQKYPSANITGQIKETREGIAYYEIESLDSGKHRDVLFQADGRIIEVAETIPPTELPRFVRDSVMAKYPGAAISSAERSTRDLHVEYELVLDLGRKKMEVVVNSAGKVFKLK